MADEQMIVREQATVYRAAGRRFFSLRSATMAQARAVIRKRCQCEPAEYDAVGMTYRGYACKYHADERGDRILKRLARRFLKNARKGDHL
jgi:hypothetical protein